MENIDISTIKKMALDCKNINVDYTFSDFLIAHTGSYVSRDKLLDWFRYYGLAFQKNIYIRRTGSF